DVIDGFAFQMQAKNSRAGGRIGRRHEQNAIEAAWPAKCAVQMPWGIRRAEYQHSLVARLHAVKLGEKLVDKMTPRAGLHVATACAEGIDFVKEQYAWRILAR